jgi:hypothetical protein
MLHLTLNKPNNKNMENNELLKIDGFDDCIIGLIERFGMEPVLCYDKERIVTKIMTEEGIHFEQAVEHFEYNIIGSWVGKRTPCFLTKHFDSCLVHESY